MSLSPILRRGMREAWRILRFFVLLVVALFLLGGSIVPPMGLSSLVRAQTRNIEFDFGNWTVEAIAAKISGWGLNLERFIAPQVQSQLVLDYLDQVRKVQKLDNDLLFLYANPDVLNPEEASRSLKKEIEAERQRLSVLAPIAESILQGQLMDVIRNSGLAYLGQVIPPSLFQTSEIPYSLIVSPRTEINQVLDISLSPDVSIEERDELENLILKEMEYSALVVPIGGIGTYPTMVMQTTNLVWLTEVIAHEWVHNYLTLRPLGINYFTNAKLRTINETTASLAGKELGLMILKKYYPEFVPEETNDSDKGVKIVPVPKVFDYRAEMRTTRVEVDRLLAAGAVDDAEAYMETRRKFLWENGYTIRKLNQAYFAFYGAYNDVPGGGAAGEDPVGPAVINFRAQFNSLADFLKAISWVNSFDELLKLSGN